MKRMLTMRLAPCDAAALTTHATSTQTWHTADNFQYIAGKHAGADVITRDPAGNPNSAFR
jgi:hypothetical protein